MSKKVETGDAVAKIRGRPPIEYLRKLAPAPEEAEKYLVLAEKAEIKKLSQLGKRDQLFDIYVPLLDCKVEYGLAGMNEIIEWEESGFDLGTPPTLDDDGKVVDPGKPGNRVDQIKAMRKLAYLMLHKADMELTEDEVGELPPQVITQIIAAISEHTPFFGAAQSKPAAASMRKSVQS
jgi:hypothetical protein